MRSVTRALVLEGGGMRGTFTAGVLEAFAEEWGSGRDVFDFVVACSAGVCTGLPGRFRSVVRRGTGGNWS